MFTLNKNALKFERRNLRSDISAMFDVLSSYKENKNVCRFVSLFFACSTIPNDILNKFCDAFVADSKLELLFSCNFLKDFSSKRMFAIGVLKRLIQQIEKSGDVVPDCIYERLCDLMSKNEESFCRIFVDFTTRDCILLCENNNQISGGTTGLSCWQASCLMAEFLRNKLALPDLLQRNDLILLELGSGCGLAGISAGKYLESFSDLTFTDYNKSVLQQLRRNVELNFDSETFNKITLKELNWLDHDLASFQHPDVVFASDVIYDKDLIPSLCSLLRDLNLLQGCVKHDRFVVTYIACTVRNSETIDFFKTKLVSAQNKLRINRVFLCEAEGDFFEVQTLDGNNEISSNKKISFEPSFLFSSALQLPTIIFEIFPIEICKH